MNHAIKNRILITVILSVLMLEAIVINIENGKVEAQIGVLNPTPGHSATPSPAPRNTTITFTISGFSEEAPHLGTQIVVYDPRNFPGLSLPTHCSPPNNDILPSPFGSGIKWELRADTDAVGLGDRTDFLDLTSTRVSYTIPSGAAFITIKFGDGGRAEITTNFGATISPSLPPERYAFIDVGGGPVATPLSGPGTDNTLLVGEYLFVSCGSEGDEDPALGDPYLGDATFLIIRNNSTTTTQSNPSTNNVAPGTSISDKATVSSVPLGLTPAPTGNVRFFICGPGFANPITSGVGCPSGGTPVGGNITLVNGMATSPPINPTTPGRYCWRAQYFGDGNYNSSNHTNDRTGGDGECFEIRLGKIIIVKDAVPNDPKDFDYDATGTGLADFSLDDDGTNNNPLSNSKMFSNLNAGSYSVKEILPVDPFLLTSILCDDPSGGTTTNLATGKANINLAAGETVTCTFKNVKTSVPQPPTISCGGGIFNPDAQPEDAISMTSIRNGNIVKTIHAEKQIFDCELPQGEIPVIADVTIIAEIYENIDTKTILSKQAVAITCIKDPARVRMLECDTSTPTTDRIPVTNCVESDVQHPQEMNSVQKGNTAKTIETQKEVFQCSMNTPDDTTDDKKVDLLLFTELFQNLNLQTTQDPQIMSMKCVIKIDTVTVEACRFMNHPV